MNRHLLHEPSDRNPESDRVAARHQRADSRSNAHVGKEFEESVQNFFSSKQGIELKANHKVPVGFATKKDHKFDLGSNKPRILVECKSYKWTSGGNIPSAKIRSINEAMLLFSVASGKFRKILMLLKDLKGNQSLAAYYLRTQGHLIPPRVEIWEFDEVRKQGQRVR